MAAPTTLVDTSNVPVGTATNKLAVDATVSIAADSTVDLNKVKGTATDVNNGAVSAGTLRVTIANNSTGVVGLNAGAAIVGKVGIDQTTPGTTNRTFVSNVSEGEYETVAAGQTAQVLGATGATGDFLAGLLVVPATTSPGNVIILDNATSITVFTGGASSVSNLVPFYIPIGANSVSGAWKVTTGNNVSVIGIGNFT